LLLKLLFSYLIIFVSSVKPSHILRRPKINLKLKWIQQMIFGDQIMSEGIPFTVTISIIIIKFKVITNSN